jgi:hypothetical protein
MNVPEKLVESVAEGMWQLVRHSPDCDWKWCIDRNPYLAEELRFRARCAVMHVDYTPVERTAPRLDLSFKEAFVGKK